MHLSLIKNVENSFVFLTRKVFPYDKFLKARNSQVTFAEKPQMNINSVKKQKLGYLN